MEHSFELINEFLANLFAYGPIWVYLILIAASFTENVFPPFPGDFFTLAAGALAAAGWLNIFLVFLMVYVGGIGSTMLVYYLGYKYGRGYFLKRDYRLFSAADILRLEVWFNRRGGLLLVFSRFIIGARAAITLVAGIGKYNPVKFCLFSSISFWIFNALFLFSSYIFVIGFDTIAHYFRAYEKIAWPIIIIAFILLVIWKIRKLKK